MGTRLICRLSLFAGLAGASCFAPLPTTDLTHTEVPDSSACTSGSLRCAGNVLQVCAQNTWTTQQDCSASGGVCSAAAGGPFTCHLPTDNADLLQLNVVDQNPNNAPIFSRVGLNSAPTVLLEGVYRMWWSGVVAGSPHILYAESTNLDGPWHAHGSTVANSFNDVFSPTGNANNFDSTAVEHPSVVIYHSVIYMYYDGSNGKSRAIGVASSSDGLTWTRLNNGAPIVNAANLGTNTACSQGAQHPSVTVVNNLYYLFYNDTTGFASDASCHGIYVVRAVDPLFQTGFEELQINGFGSSSLAVHTHYPLLAAAAVDVMYVDALDAYALALDVDPNATYVALYDAQFHPLVAQNRLMINGAWEDSPGLVARPDRHALPSPNCGSVGLDVVRAVASSPNDWNLAHDGAQLTFALTCSQVPLAHIYEGSQILSAGEPNAVVAGGRRVIIDELPVAFDVAPNAYTVSGFIYSQVPLVAHIVSANTAYQTNGFPGGYYDATNNVFLAVSCDKALLDNDSSLTFIAQNAYMALPSGPALYCAP